MELKDIIRPGDKIDFRVTAQVSRYKNGKGEKPILYKSKVFDFTSERTIEIAMPLEGGRMVVFQKNLSCFLVFYTKSGLYSGVCSVKDRYKRDNIYILEMEFDKLPTKFQRREFFRIPCMIDMKYIDIFPEVAGLETTQELIDAVHTSEFIWIDSNAVILDISGGGIRFLTDHMLERDSCIYAEIHLKNDRIDQYFHLACKIIESVGHDQIAGKFLTRAKFVFKDLKDREAIVRFVFEEERRIRKRENG